MNKRLLIIGGVIFLILVVVGILLGKKSGGPTGTPPAPAPTFAPPAPTGIFPQPTNVAFSFASLPAIPASLPGYSYQPMSLSSVEDMAAKAAPTLNLSATPSALTRGGSYTKTWSRGAEANLTVTQTNDLITISYHQIKSPQTPGTFSPDVAVQQFLLMLVPSVQSISLRTTGSSTGPFDGLLVLDTPAPRSYTDYFYSYAAAGIPLVTADLSLSPVSVIADGGGIIRSASIVPPPASLSQTGAIPLLSKDQILASLSAGRGVLLDVHSPQAPEQGIVPTFTRFTISDIKIAYAPKNTFFYPAFYLSGSGVTASGQRQDATIFLWGFAEGAL